jgi:RimJ/RimL family protein N-acetyltransferase
MDIESSRSARPPGPERVEAAPLTGLRIRLSDLGDLAALLTDRRVVPTLTALGNLLSDPEIAARLEAHLWHWEEHGFGAWIFRDASGAFVARGALERRRIDDVDEVELMYAVAADRWRQGHGTRVARALVDVAFDVLRLGSLVAFVLPDNYGSHRILDRCGFSFDRLVEHGGRPHELFRLRRAS